MPYRDRLNGKPLNKNNVHRLYCYDAESGLVYRIKINGSLKKIGCRRNEQGHMVATFGGRMRPLTHLIWLIVYGKFPKRGRIIEHKDCCPYNNRLSNLREGNQSLNMANIRVTARSKSGVKGVFWDSEKERWSVYIGKDYKTRFVGRYDTIKEAKLAYDRKAAELFGEFARA